MKAPGTAYDDPVLGKDPQPAAHAATTSTRASDNGGVHSTPASRTTPSTWRRRRSAAMPGRRRDSIWYDTITDRSLRSSSSFATFAKHTVMNAGHRYGTHSTERKAVADAWREVGVKVR